ncbi:hypothetical protein FAI41_06550 [Acetobacteraceae bacterium]|nr:hypothetical protein FAI41_06550 [Acetobacteraceae bacterium]
MSSPILHRDFLEPLERKALFFLQQKNLPLEEMSPESARRLLSEILFQHLEELQLYRRYLAGAFIFEFIRKNGRHYNRKNFEKSWKWLIQEKREDHPALNHTLGLAGEREEEAILQTAVRYWYHFRWHAWERQGMVSRAIMGRKKREEAEEMQEKKKVSLAFIQTNQRFETGKIVRLRDESGNIFEVLPVPKEREALQKKASLIAEHPQENTERQKALPAPSIMSQEIFIAEKQKSFVKKS